MIKQPSGQNATDEYRDDRRKRLIPADSAGTVRLNLSTRWRLAASEEATHDQHVANGKKGAKRRWGTRRQANAPALALLLAII